MKKTFSNTLDLTTLKEGILSLFKLSLYHNAIYLLNSAMYALTWFFFWVVAARLYPPRDTLFGQLP
jgi:hypothetical protein